MNYYPSFLQNRIMSAEDAARLIGPDMCVGLSGFTIFGNPKLVTHEMAVLGQARNMKVFSGAGGGEPMDGELARAGLVKYRTPYNSNKSMRDSINRGEIAYNDIHLSHLSMLVNRGISPKLNWAVVECSGITEEGIIPAPSVGAADCLVRNCEKLILEVNTGYKNSLYGLHDIYEIGEEPIPIRNAVDRAGKPYIPCDLNKIAAIVLNDDITTPTTYKPIDDVSKRISEHIVTFLKAEVAAGRQPENLRPIQSGVGNVGNAVLAGLSKDFRGLTMYTELAQENAIKLLKDGVVDFISTAGVAFTNEAAAEFIDNIEFYKQHMVVRPVEISNHPEVIRRLQVISMNTPIEVDIYGNVNSTHVMGTSVMNGLGGSGDFARNAGLTIFATGSLAKGGSISCVVPMVSHVDHTEHDVDVIVTEWGAADLRWKCPRERALEIINKCAHPMYRKMLMDYFEEACAVSGGQTPHILSKALSWHQRYVETGTMMP